MKILTKFGVCPTFLGFFFAHVLGRKEAVVLSFPTGCDLLLAVALHMVLTPRGGMGMDREVGLCKITADWAVLQVLPYI